MNMICKYARQCSFVDCGHRHVHEVETDDYSCNVIPCLNDIRPYNVGDIFCIPIIKVKR